MLSSAGGAGHFSSLGAGPPPKFLRAGVYLLPQAQKNYIIYNIMPCTCNSCACLGIGGEGASVVGASQRVPVSMYR